MAKNPLMLDINLIENFINAKQKNLVIELFNKIDSTNEYLKNKPIDDFSKLYFCLAEQQTAGKGRLGRSWHSPFATNIYLSCSFIITKNTKDLSGLSLVIGLSLIKTLSKLGFPNLKIKWPNDIYFDKKKLAGILVELSLESTHLTKVVIGAGINVNMRSSETQSIQQPWTSLSAIKNCNQDRNQIAGTFITQLVNDITDFRTHDLSYWLKDWTLFDFFYQQPISLVHNGNTIDGIEKGVDQMGRLLIEDKSGNLQAYTAGEISIIKKA